MTYPTNIYMFSSAILVLVTAVAGQPVWSVPRLGIECHSFNDLGTWPQLLMKDVRWYKLDFSLCTQSSCEQYSTFGKVPGRGNSTDCFEDGGATYCCICMRGDASERPNLVQPFNTTWDMLAFLADPSNAHLYPPAGDPRPVMYGMDWGGPGVNFLSGPAVPIIHGWLLALNATIAAAGIAVRPYFDAGLNGWFNNLDKQCYAGQCTQEQQLLQSLEWPSETEPYLPPQSQDPYNRYAIVNSDEDSFNTSCYSDAWNKSLAKADKYPYLWYEPSSQLEMLMLLDGWATCPNTPADKRNVSDGLVLVTNQQPEMFEVYASFGIGRGMDINFLPSSNASNPKILLVPSTNVAVADYWLYIVSSPKGSSLYELRSYAFRAGIQPSASSLVQQTTLDARLTTVASMTQDQTDATIVVASSSGCVLQVSVDQRAGTFAVGTPVFISVPGRQLLSLSVIHSSGYGNYFAYLDAALPAGNNGSTHAVLVASPTLKELVRVPVSKSVSADLGASMALRFSLNDTNGYTLEGVVVYGATTMVPVSRAQESVSYTLDKALRAGDASNNKVAAQALELTKAAAHEAAAKKEGFSTSATARELLYAAYINVSLPHSGSPNGAVFVVNNGANDGATPTRVAFGAAPHVTMLEFGGRSLVMETHTDGLCQCGLLMNNGDVDHCLLPTAAMDDDLLNAPFQSVQYLLNYNYGTLEAWRELANPPGAPVPVQGGPQLSGCHDRIISGKFEVGTSVSAALYVAPLVHHEGDADPPGPELAVLAAHDGDVVAPLLTTAFCGAALYKPALVLDAWQLVQPSKLT